MIKRDQLIRILIAINLILCIYLIYEEFQSTGYCIIGSSCNDVWNSAYAEVLGVPLPWMGLFAFLILLLLNYIKNKDIWIERIYLLSVGAGALVSLYLISVQAFVLREFCIACMGIDTLTLVIAILASEDFGSNNK